MTLPVPTYSDIAAEKRLQRDKNFKKEWLVAPENLPPASSPTVIGWIEKCGELTSKQLDITAASAPEILLAVRDKVWTAFEVAEAFCHRASLAHQLTNCLSEVFFEEGLQQARELDEYYERTGQLKGPLHGLPISLKDNINVKGQATTVGIVSFSFSPEKFEEDSVILAMLRDMGAVFYVKTNVPVAMMMPESINHIYGNTTNPLNRNLSAGGSSGGEAALLALKGSPLGIGSDIGGSIRIPASFNNLYSLKPTFGRFPTYGARSGLPGLESVNSVNGPLTTSIDSLELYCKTLVAGEPWLYDPKVVSLPWRTVKLPETLNIAVLDDDGVVRPTPPLLRGMKMVREKLTESGHVVIDWDPEDHLRLSELITEFFLSDGGKHVKDECNKTGEPFFPYMRMYGTAPEKGVATLWALQAERTKLIKRFLDRWNATASETGNGRPIDAIILPATPFPGNPNGKFQNYVGYTSPFNAVDYSVGTIPVATADRDLDAREVRETFYGETDKAVYDNYDADESHGGAVCLQVVGRKFEEEKVVELLKALKAILGS